MWQSPCPLGAYNQLAEVLYCQYFSHHLLLNPTSWALRITKCVEVLCICNIIIQEVVWDYLDYKMKFQVLLTRRPRPSNFL